MKTDVRPIKLVRGVLLGLLVCTSLTFAQNRNPTSKLYVADLEGQSEIDTGERIEEIRAKSVHNAQGTVIETKVDSNNSMVFSNGTGIFLDPETRVEVRRFVQEPFTPNRTDLETEPSISQTYGFVPRGRVGICAPRMVAGSSMVYATPHASVSIRGKRVVVEANDFETKISSVEGEVTVTGEGTGSSGRVISDGQQAVITRLPGQAPVIDIRPIPEEEVPIVEDKVTMACNARRTVYFEVAEQKSELNDTTETTLPEDAPKEEEEEDEGDTEESDPETESNPDIGGESDETGGEAPSFGEIFLEEPTGEEGAQEIVPVELTPVDTVDREQVNTISPSAVTTGG